MSTKPIAEWSALASSLTEPVIVIAMGVSGSGKTTVAALLVAALGWQFREGDDLHPAANVAKMLGGTPLADADRLPWLEKIAEETDLRREQGSFGAVTCSALKRSYGDIIIGSQPEVQQVYLEGAYDLIQSRLVARHEHFMPAALLNSQFTTLQEPASDEHPIVIEVGGKPADIAAEIVRQFGKQQATGDRA